MPKQVQKTKQTSEKKTEANVSTTYDWQGALDYVVKPDDPDGLGEAALEAAIRNAVEKTVLSSEVARLRTQVGENPEGTAFWGPGSAMRHVMAMVERVADSEIGAAEAGR